MVQADTIVTGGVQGLDRYSYVVNNPIIYTDPSGHAQKRSDYQQKIHNDKMRMHNPLPEVIFQNTDIDGDGVCEPEDGDVCWTQEEKDLFMAALNLHPWAHELSGWTIVATRVGGDPKNPGVGGSTSPTVLSGYVSNANGTLSYKKILFITIYDFAYQITPDNHRGAPSDWNFMAIVFHELTHAICIASAFDDSNGDGLCGPYLKQFADSTVADYPVDIGYPQKRWNAMEDLAVTLTLIYFGSEAQRRQILGGRKSFLWYSWEVAMDPRGAWIISNGGLNSCPITWGTQ